LSPHDPPTKIFDFRGARGIVRLCYASARLCDSPQGGSGCGERTTPPLGGVGERKAQAGGGTIVNTVGGLFDAIVFDLGISSMQIDTPMRGFSFRFDAPLDMRMGGGKSATELIENSTVDEIARILRDYGDVKKAGPIARAIKDAAPQTTFQLRDLIYNPKDIAPVFQAIRIAVNDEMGEIERALDAVPDLLAPGGICAVVTFHSLEDRLVKNTFREWTETKGDPRLPVTENSVAQFKLLKTVTPSDAEIAANPRARSAHMRAVRKV